MKLNGEPPDSFLPFCFNGTDCGHTHIDILKVEIEGWEFDTLRAVLNPDIEIDIPVSFGQLQIEVHTRNQRLYGFLSWRKSIESVGLRPFLSKVRPSYALFILIFFNI